MAADLIDPETLRRPFGHTHVVEVTAQARQVLETARPPASTAVEVRRLAVDGLFIEVEAVAVLEEGDPHR